MFSYLECLRELYVEGNPFCKGPSWAVCKNQVLSLLPASLKMLDSSEVGIAWGIYAASRGRVYRYRG